VGMLYPIIAELAFHLYLYVKPEAQMEFCWKTKTVFQLVIQEYQIEGFHIRERGYYEEN